MIQQHVRKSGDTFEVVIPNEEIERLKIHEGQMVALEVTPIEFKPVLPPDLTKVVEELREETTPVMQYLKDK